MSQIKTAIFPVGGLGTRFLPATKSLPKEMLPIVNKPLIQYAFEEAKNAGIEKFIFITGRNKNAIANHFDHAYELESQLDKNSKNSELNKVIGWMPKAGQIAFIRQQRPLGLGHAILCAKNFINKNEAFAVILADELLMPDPSQKSQLELMIEKFYATSSSIIGVDEIDKKNANKYGIISHDHNQKITDMIEKPDPNEAPSNLAINGRYILKYDIFNFIEKLEIEDGKEIQLTDALKKMALQDPFYFIKNSQKRFDCGSVIGYIEANLAFGLNNHAIVDDLKKILKKYL
jgi:UTP-glucose-1-phosphate uridylyltransferase